MNFFLYNINKQIIDFISQVKLYGKVIIQELLASEKDKVIKRRKVGGIAGGDKFIERGIMFKLCRDKDLGGDRGFMYGDGEANEEFAAKAASHDLKGACQYFRFFLNKLTEAVSK